MDLLFSRYRALAYRVAYRLLGQEADALDAVQEGFINALKNIQRFQGRSTFKTWLLRVVSNAALDLGRKRSRREAYGCESLGSLGAEDEPAMPGREPSFGMEQQDLRRQLDLALATLPEAQRQTLVLHLEGELSYREIAELLQISIGTVMSRLFYARQRLKCVLTPCVES
ncbi:rna polymerase ecf-type sigma factor : RNA polymerase sigma factor, sigma-70 family OS=Singulisphaera acidiphila (strain ATCC BAA-1392 / DSM 18658 / VKM B-2454 / MOB10) GN=Sinac_0328 PE=4 SV=1: Sigma70_r2: Sigma70_r4_2 [Tuwongella immobilis]|uniref:HTH luxR-type domain-containing protein n=1 Tax=Tuwongella immobilis TaxID=692036 RepID=A0A6C2YNI7_9BACT|nr:rna polymerase ecf-type sigma factor : RNA polymerase sigma factor, sigma-70 family OS=Singulisphaera acidiphila (strain ATCC BAA-1392 / DSM 18658 / VKM B-2454 / MOB10) GN=Sinac_0328 PE=4 SV=1: Sigma70_r2: Sigma70_r4_2 [Tuwongella immobilis]VTS01441.1 rna polymerase ecf-type sigma factor : RNA polymerase sigma factor, sigma-70 family OS=Singulisphaera acidiphila (strain ATCC BAA-1392 / DSM 18658 / VKM B-2454 / MOB10) GN=Sinac_0328 PE=4 SV=1: Sigma70_r2: Sigma70_r4_2 [Tuwongella immobilis]